MLSKQVTRLGSGTVKAAFVAATLALAPVAAMAQGTAQPGSEVTLTQQDVESWKQFPVMNENGEQIGEVTAVMLGDDGKIEELHIKTGQELGLGEKTVKVSPDQFTTDGKQITLTVSKEEMQGLPEATTTQ